VPRPPASTRRRTGRPRGSPPNRQAILDAARLQFSERGYSGATMRRIAAAAGVDAALVHHYFGSKDELLVAAMPPDDLETTLLVIRGGRRGIGARLLRATLQIYGDEKAANWHTLLGLLRSAATHEDAARVLRETVARGGAAQLIDQLQVPQPRLRVALVVSQLVGLIMSRYVLRLEPLAGADVEALVALYAPALQRFLVGRLPGDASD
jgi:AcrR family transcriptional regulator